LRKIRRILIQFPTIIPVLFLSYQCHLGWGSQLPYDLKMMSSNMPWTSHTCWVSLLVSRSYALSPREKLPRNDRAFLNILTNIYLNQILSSNAEATPLLRMFIRDNLYI
jgi:hypothetical protein